MKLSNKQKEIVIAMRKGKPMYKRITYAYIQESGIDFSIATFWALVKKGIIIRKSNTYQLTVLGKTINI